MVPKWVIYTCTSTCRAHKDHDFWTISNQLQRRLQLLVPGTTTTTVQSSQPNAFYEKIGLLVSIKSYLEIRN